VEPDLLASIDRCSVRSPRLRLFPILWSQWQQDHHLQGLWILSAFGELQLVHRPKATTQGNGLAEQIECIYLVFEPVLGPFKCRTWIGFMVRWSYWPCTKSVVDWLDKHWMRPIQVRPLKDYTGANLLLWVLHFALIEFKVEFRLPGMSIVQKTDRVHHLVHSALQAQ
jgi:hypothetical protein